MDCITNSMGMSSSKLLELVMDREACDRQGGLACCSPWGCKESDMTEQLNRTELKIKLLSFNLLKISCVNFFSYLSFQTFSI